MKVLIFTNGEYGDYSFCEKLPAHDYILCADNGMKHAKKLGIKPNEILGDFDSCNLSDLDFYKEQGIKIITSPCEKDETDTELAIDRAIELGASTIYVVGGLGTRIDHTLANIHLLYKAWQKGVRAILYNAYNQIQLISDHIHLEGVEGDLVSLIPFTPQVRGVRTKNLAYALDGAEFVFGKPYGVSNYMTHVWAEVSIQEGLLLVMKIRD